MRSSVTPIATAAERPAVDVVTASEVLASLLAFIRRHLAVAVVIAVFGNVAWAAYTTPATANFVATGKLQADLRLAAQLRQEESYSPANAPEYSPSSKNAPVDTAELQTRVDLLKSNNVAEKVIHDLNLTEDAELARPGLRSRVAISITAPLGRLPKDDLSAGLAEARSAVEQYLASLLAASGAPMRRTAMAMLMYSAEGIDLTATHAILERVNASRAPMMGQIENS
jgi:hypothetical protein